VGLVLPCAGIALPCAGAPAGEEIEMAGTQVRLSLPAKWLRLIEVSGE